MSRGTAKGKKRETNKSPIPSLAGTQRVNKSKAAYYAEIGYSDGKAKTNPLGYEKPLPSLPQTKDKYPMTKETEWRLMEIAKQISEGKSRKTCLEEIQQNYNVGYAQAKNYYNSALAWLIPDDLDQYQKGLVQANVERLETIIQEGISRKDDARRGSDYLRTAKEAIAELNRMLGVGGQNVKIAQKSEDGSEQIIQINFD